MINDGSELFGNNTILANGRKAANGFAALADLDDNGDGVINSSDTAWAELQHCRMLMAMALDDATDANGDSQLTAPYYSNNRTETRSLREMVEAFKATNTDGSANLDKTAREALAENILLRWAGAEGATRQNYSNMTFTMASKFAVVEAFRGEQWRGGQGNRNLAYSTAQNFSKS